jgi:hypothetical protein
MCPGVKSELPGIFLALNKKESKPKNINLKEKT